jgi:hypothetical protein
VTIQCQFEEATGRIVFSYSAGWGLVGAWVGGIDAPVDSRFIVPPGLVNSSNGNNGYLGNDIVFTPRTLTYSGTLLYDKIVSDATGIGNSTLSNQPLGGVRIELRRDGGIVASTSTTAADGTFSISGLGVASTSTGTVAAVARNAACTVSGTAGGASPEWTAIAGVAYSVGGSVGSLTLGAGADASGALRAAFNVARDCSAAYAWASTRTTDAIPRLDVLVDPTSVFVTDYQKSGASPALMRVASVQGGTSDVWDDAIVVKTYARHVLASIAALPTTTPDYRFDAVTDPQNAFAEAFGYSLWSSVTGGAVAYDGKSATSTVAYDLEHPTITVAKGPDVAGCVAGALHDLVDPADETTDLVDGSAAPGRTFALVDAFAVAPTASTFLQAWVDAGYDGHAITRAFVANGALADDALEPNDAADETASLGAVGFPPRALVLNRFDEDWFSVTLPAAASTLAVDATYDHLTTGATAAVEIRDAGGAVLATGALVPTTGAVHAQTGPVAAGAYKIRVQHVSGGTVPTYALQAYVPPTMNAKPVHDWTVGRPYDLALGVGDGIAPFTLTTPSSFMPPGLGLNSATLRATGTPSTAGEFALTLQLRDGGSPANVVQRTQTVTIHDAFKLPIAPFVGFPAGKTIDVVVPTHEGTPPFTLTVSSGALTSGLAFAPNSLHVTGVATVGPSSAFELDGVDVAGSADHVATRAVVAVQLADKKTPADLAAGVDACGWWFDAVEGSTVTFAVATGKGMPKRALTGAFLAPDRSLVATGKIVGKLGGVSASKLVCPTSGRYYFVASTTDAGLATQLLGTATVKLPKSGKGLNKTFAPNATTTIEFGAVPGSTATVKFAGDKKATLVAKVVAVYDPTGAQVSTAGLVKPSATGGTLPLPLPVGGTWTVVLGATSQNGTPGRFTYSYSVKPLKGATYSAE